MVQYGFESRKALINALGQMRILVCQFHGKVNKDAGTGE